jgi:hypothetical protein
VCYCACIRLVAGLLWPRLSFSKLSKALSSGKVSGSATLSTVPGTVQNCEYTVISGERLDCLELVAISRVVDSHHQNSASDSDSAYYFYADPCLTLI